MKLFSKIYTCLLLGIIGLLIVEGNLNYEEEITQFDTDMTEKAKEIGRIMSGVISHAWNESGAEKAISLVEDTNYPNHSITISLSGIDNTIDRFGTAHPELLSLNDEKADQPISFIALNDNREKYRYTFMPIHSMSKPTVVLQLTQSLAPLEAYTQRMLIRSLVITTLLALVSGIIIYIFIHLKIRRPLEILSKKAIEIGKGNLSSDLELKGEDELVSLGRAMNDMCTRLLIAKEKIHFEHLARLKTLEQLRHTEKLSTIGQISAGIAHEMGTPLNVVDGRAKMILAGPTETTHVIKCADIIKNQAERMTLIIRQLLDYSRKKKPGSRIVEDLETLLKQVFHLLTPIATKQGINLNLKTSSSSPFNCRIDTQQIQQVFMNIIMNGIQATRGSGEVQVEITTTVLKSMIHTDDQFRTFIRVEVIDNGDGIPEENLQEIFTPFFTTKRVGLGTGLGLSIAQEIIEEHGGWIEVKNRSIRGTRFSIFLLAEVREQ